MRLNSKSSKKNEYSLKDIQDTIPEGEIYTLYAINLRDLFQLECESEINKIRHQIVIKKASKKDFTNELASLKEEKNKFYAGEKNLEKLRNVEKFLISDEFLRFTKEIDINKGLNLETNNTVKLKVGRRNLRYKVEKAKDEDEIIINNGHKFSVFRGNLRSKWLNSTAFKFTKKGKKTKNISYYLRLSHLGILQIKKVEKLRLNNNNINEEKSLITILEELLKSRNQSKSSFDNKDNDILQVAVAFAKCLDFTEVSNYTRYFDNNEIQAKELDEINSFRVERQRYNVLLFSKLVSKKYLKYREISASYIHKNNPEVILSILEGTLTYDNKSPSIAKIPDRKSEDIIDISTWIDELCVFNPDRCFILFDKEQVLQSDKEHPEPYIDYWKCIVRGIEFSLALRASLNLIESKTTELLMDVPKVLRNFDSINKTEDEKITTLNKTEDEKIITFEQATKELRIFAEQLANILKIVPSLRSIAIETNAFRSNHAVQKFIYLNKDCFNLRQTLNNIQQNIDELNNFLIFFKQEELEHQFKLEADRESEEDRKLNKIALVFTITSIMYVFASFTTDLTSLLDSKANDIRTSFSLSPKWLSIILYFVVLIIITPILYFIIKRFLSGDKRS